jgi:hypothetical protein
LVCHLFKTDKLSPATGVFTNLLEQMAIKRDYGTNPPGAMDARGNIYFGIGRTWENADATTCG